MNKITSEIFIEGHDFVKNPQNGMGAISKFTFKCPSYMIEDMKDDLKSDSEGDIDLDRGREETLLIEHSTSTALQLVGLQIWRGAFLLSDYILSNPNLFKQEIILELGSGVGLTSIVASFLAKKVICTDINVGGILDLIKRNFSRNKSLITAQFVIEELNFLHLDWSNKLKKILNSATVILAADVIYDDQITDGFVCTLEKLLSVQNAKTAYIALEKRYVFAVTEMDTVAPMYEEFLRCIGRHNLKWNIEYIEIDFPRYFNYERLSQMILMKITNESSSPI